MPGGRPLERDGVYRKTSLEVREDLLAQTPSGDRRDFFEKLLERFLNEGEERTKPHLITELRALAANLQALSNLAEAQAPDLLEDIRWQKVRVYLERECHRLGVTTWSDIRGKKFLEAIERLEKMSKEKEYMFAAYTRDIDDGFGIQTVYAVNGVIVQQTIDPKQGGGHYTGDGNPEWVGQPVQVLRNQGFKRLYGRQLEVEEQSYYSEVEEQSYYSNEKE